MIIKVLQNSGYNKYVDCLQLLFVTADGLHVTSKEVIFIKESLKNVTAAPVRPDKLNRLQRYREELLKFIHEHPGKATLGSLAMAGVGISVGLAGIPVIVFGSVVCAFGKATIAVAFWVAGIGTVIGCVNKSADTVKQSLQVAGVIATAAIGLYLTGSLLKATGYLMITGGVALSMTSVAVAGSAFRQLRKSQQRKRDPVAIAVVQAVRKLQRNNKECDGTKPVFIVDLKQEK